MNVGILGFGEIGKAISKFYNSFYVKERTWGDFPERLDILHVCIPFFEGFVDVVSAEITSHNPEMVIIHSTVPIGTTTELFQRHPIVVHSPVRGIHPELYKGIQTFVKYIGTDNFDLGAKVSSHLFEIGIHSNIVLDSRNTEAMKLWDTTIYGWNIVLQKAIYEYCQKHNLNFDAVYTEANRTYNDGYAQLNRPEYCKFILRQVNGKMGGHCVINNCKLLDCEISKIILEHNDTY